MMMFVMVGKSLLLFIYSSVLAVIVLVVISIVIFVATADGYVILLCLYFLFYVT